MDNACTSSGIKMTETPGIDTILLKVKSSQGRVNKSFITDNNTLRKKKQKCKPMNVVNKMYKSVVADSMKDEEKFEMVANTRSKSMLLLLGMIKKSHVRKILVLQKFIKNCWFVTKVFLLIWMDLL